MKLSANKLLSIEELKLGVKLEEMNILQYEVYCNKLDEFIELFPKKEKELKEAFAAGKDGLFVLTVMHIQNLLNDIYATELAKNGEKLIADISTENRSALEAQMTFFLSSVSTLSIGIQMAQYDDSIPVVPVVPTASLEPQEQLQQKCILAVDDVSLMLNSVKAVLNGTNYKFVGVTSGAAALKFLSTQSPDLFILDVEMPNMNGYELAAKIKEQGHKAPIIFLTGNATKDYVLKAVQAGATDFIVKPIIHNQVLEKIKQYIGD